MYRREVSVCVDGHQRTQATGLPAIGCCFLFLSAATRHTDAWQRARVQAGSSTQSSDYRDAGSSTSSCESAPSSSCRSSCRRVPAGRIWGCHWTAIRRCGAPPMWFASCRSPWASCQQNWTWLSRASTREEKKPVHERGNSTVVSRVNVACHRPRASIACLQCRSGSVCVLWSLGTRSQQSHSREPWPPRRRA